MVFVGDDAPDFTVPLANGDVEQFTLSDHLGDGPVVLAFFPAAFTGTCTTEMCTFRDRLSAFEDVDATVYGVSVDLPFALNEFRRQNGLTFGLLSDANRDVIAAYEVAGAFPELGLREMAKRAVVVVDGGGTVAYRWVRDERGTEPDYEEIRDATEAAA